GQAAYARNKATELGRHLRLAVAGSALTLRPLRHALAFPPGQAGLHTQPGQAGLHTLRLESVYVSPPLASGRSVAVDYRDENYAGRIGWKEIVVRPGTGTQVRNASAPRQSISEELRAYPKNLLQSPLDVTRARAQ